MSKDKRKRVSRKISGCVTMLLISVCLCTASILGVDSPNPTATKSGISYSENLSANSDSKFLVTVKTNTLNVRAGPGTGYGSLGQLKKDAQIAALGRSADSKWLVIRYSGKNGWISASVDLVQTSEDIKSLDVIKAPVYQVKATQLPSNYDNESIQPTSAPPANACPGFNYTCPALTCAQAYACLAAGNGSLDRDNDGIPCEAQCK